MGVKNLYVPHKKTPAKGGLTWGFIRSKEYLFPQYCKENPRQATALPWIFLLSCRKIFLFGVLCSFEYQIFSCSNSVERGNTLCISRSAEEAAWKKIYSKPCKSLCEAA